MGAPYSTTLNDYTKAFTLAWEDSWDDITWLILEQSPLMWWLFNVGAVHISVAPSARLPFVHAENPNVGPYSGTAHLPVAESEYAKPFIYDEWGKISCQNVVATDKIDLNMDAERQIYDMKQAEVQQCAVTMHNYIEGDLHSARVVDGDIDGLRGALEFDTAANQAAAATRVGNVPKNATYWFNQYASIPGGFMANGVSTWATLYRQCCQWGRRPDFMPVDPSVYDGYEEWCGPERAMVDEAMGSAGFTSLRYKDAKVVPDYNITTDSGEGFMLNIADRMPSATSGYNFEKGFLDPVKGKSKGPMSLGRMQMWINRNAFFKQSPWVEAQEQHAIITKCKFHCMLVWRNLREHGCFDFAAGAYTA